MMLLGHEKAFIEDENIAVPAEVPQHEFDSQTQLLLDCIHLRAYRDALDRVAIVAATDLRGRITEVNELFCRISGYEREELIAASHNILNSGHHPKTFFEDMWRTISVGGIWRGTSATAPNPGSSIGSTRP